MELLNVCHCFWSNLATKPCKLKKNEFLEEISTQKWQFMQDTPGDGDALPVQPPLPAPPCRPGRQADMHKAMQAIGGTTHDIYKAMLAMDSCIGQKPYQAYPIQIERCGRKSRQAELKQKARHIMCLWQSHSSTSHQK